jgi:hypothetical protein
MSVRMITMPFDVAYRLVETFWHDQFTTAHAAENTVCSSFCGDSWSDFVAHDHDCPFVKAWAELADLRDELGITHEIAIAVRKI